MDDPKSIRELQAVIKTIRHTAATHKQVKLSYRDLKSHSLSVTDGDGEKLLISALHCIQDINRGSGDCVAVTFAAGPLAKQCHVFQARSSREVICVCVCTNLTLGSSLTVVFFRSHGKKNYALFMAEGKNKL